MRTRIHGKDYKLGEIERILDGNRKLTQVVARTSDLLGNPSSTKSRWPVVVGPIADALKD